MITTAGLMLVTVMAWTAPNPRCAAQEAGRPQREELRREDLIGKRFEFSWKSPRGGAVNGIALLRADGTIKGIGSPNESYWLLDARGRLIFKHADGRESTRYERSWREGGLLHFEGPFLLRSGITHRLLELPSGAAGAGHGITPELDARIRYSSQRHLYLDPGESVAFRGRDGRERHIRLVSVREVSDTVIHLVRRAEVLLAIDGREVALRSAPYVLPTEVDGLRVQVDTTSAWLEIPKRVQLSLWDASEPVVDTQRFGFPLPGYRLFSHGIQAYNEPVHLGDRDGDPGGQRFYHNYGVDMAGYEGRQKVISCIDGTVVRCDPGQGDLVIQDDQGFAVHFGHLDAMLDGIAVGARVRRGQWVAMLGRRGPSGNFSHLHVGAYLTPSDLAAERPCRSLNLYPWLVEAYLARSGARLLAVARPHRVARTGERVLFDASGCVARGCSIKSWRWEFGDGTSARGASTTKVYARPGCYIASLWIEDDQGRCDVDFCKVKIFSRDHPEEIIPTLFATYIPALRLRRGQPICFRFWPQGAALEDLRIDFGDGSVLTGYRPYSAIIHRFATPGVHVVGISAKAKGLPVAQKAKVVIQD